MALRCFRLEVVFQQRGPSIALAYQEAGTAVCVCVCVCVYARVLLCYSRLHPVPVFISGFLMQIDATMLMRRYFVSVALEEF